jgi:hypothetical protein
MAANASAQLPSLHRVAKRRPLMGTSTCLTAQLLSASVQAVVYVFQVAHWRTCGCALMCAPYADLQPTRDCGSAAPLPAAAAPQGWADGGRCVELAGALQEPGEGAAGGGPYGAADAGQEQVGTGCRRGVRVLPCHTCLWTGHMLWTHAACQHGTCRHLHLCTPMGKQASYPAGVPDVFAAPTHM